MFVNLCLSGDGIRAGETSDSTSPPVSCFGTDSEYRKRLGLTKRVLQNTGRSRDVDGSTCCHVNQPDDKQRAANSHASAVRHKHFNQFTRSHATPCISHADMLRQPSSPLNVVNSHERGTGTRSEAT